MTNIPYAALLAKFKSLADDLIEEVNGGSVTLYFQPATLTSIDPPDQVGPGGTEPNIFDRLGGRMPMTSLPERHNESGSNLEEVPTSLTIKSRVYWVPTKLDKTSNVIDRKDTAKVISYVADMQNILNATSAMIDGHMCKRTIDPTLHGMGNYYVESYWEIIQ